MEIGRLPELRLRFSAREFSKVPDGQRVGVEGGCEEEVPEEIGGIRGSDLVLEEATAEEGRLFSGVSLERGHFC